MKNLFLTLICFFFYFGYSQPGARDLSFVNFSEDCPIIRDLGMQTTGKVVVCGGFMFESFNYTHLIRLNQNGTKDASFNDFSLGNSTNEGILKLKIANDNSIFAVIGSGALNSNIIKKFDSNGNLDNNYNASVILPYSHNFEIVNGNKLIVSTNQGVVRLNADGSIDNTFNTLEVGNNVNIVKVDSNEIYIIGNFTYNGQTTYAIKIDENGIVDNTFNLQNVNTNGVTDIAKHSDGKLFIATTNYPILLSRINTDGTYDASFSITDLSIFDQANSYIQHIAIQHDGKIVYGSWSTFLRFNTDGSLDSSFILNPNINGDITSLTYLENEEKIFVTGNFCEYDSAFVPAIVKVYTLEKGISGHVYNDFNENCLNEINEVKLSNRNLLINPGNIALQTNANGFWSIDSLPAGNYTVTIDTSNTNWTVTCPITQSFTVVHPVSLTIAPSFGLVANNPCPSPTISLNMPFMRPCFTGQKINVQACNEYDATGVIPDAYSIVKLDPNLIFENASLPYTSLGNNQYRFEHGVLNPGQCVNYTIDAQVNCAAVLGQTFCMEANLFPIDDCVLDTIPTPPTGEVTPCTLPWDKSSLSVGGWCANDSIYFTISNTGELGGGDMECYSPVRIYVDGNAYILDSIKLLGGETFTYVFLGTGQTWRLEADQHPLHPGNSHPNAHVENCNPGNWTPGLVTIFPQDDADPVKDIYCGVVTGSYDPNDKRGFPSGLGEDFEILPNQDIEYIIRFQNTGTDTAFTVVVRDTLDINFDIFSVTPGVSSHNYTFRMYGPRVLEWTFPNILLPDSTTNEPLSNGFLSFKVKQKPNLSDGTLLKNDADIYFDFNEPIITNETSHKVQRRTFQASNSLTQLSKTKTGIKLYPNPTKLETTLSFSTYQKQVAYKLLNLSGQVVLEKINLYGKEVKVNLSEVPNGMYLMEVKTNLGTEMVKVVRE
jgi:uncharacterized delta-60 repeat protein/uncharacterized repeat protein (TIGR01451 family)